MRRTKLDDCVAFARCSTDSEPYFAARNRSAGEKFQAATNEAMAGDNHLPATHGWSVDRLTASGNPVEFIIQPKFQFRNLLPERGIGGEGAGDTSNVTAWAAEIDRL
jgi:hypothetical protein